MRNKNKRILLPAQYLGMKKDHTETFNEKLLLLPLPFHHLLRLLLLLSFLKRKLGYFFNIIILKPKKGKIK